MKNADIHSTFILLLYQQLQPDLITNTPYYFFKDDTIKNKNIDVDVSLSYKITSFLQAGVSVMNVAGTKLYADMFVPDSSNQSYINQRAYGICI